MAVYPIKKGAHVAPFCLCPCSSDLVELNSYWLVFGQELLRTMKRLLNAPFTQIFISISYGQNSHSAVLGSFTKLQPDFWVNW